MNNVSINNKYIVENLIGKGKFGQIFKGHIHKKNTLIAIKIEPSEGELKSIKHEVTILNYLYKRGCRNIPYIYWYGKYNMDICMVMNYLPGSLSLENIPCLESFMIKCIDILKNIHEHYVIHRDIKPQNFMFDEHGELHLIDFGLATVYVDDDHHHIKCTGCSQSYILGTPKYISYHIHEGYVPSRRDDLISVGYLYLFLKYGSLPWSEDKMSSTTSFSELHVLHPNNQFRKEKKEWSNISKQLRSSTSVVFSERKKSGVIRDVDRAFRSNHMSELGEPGVKRTESRSDSKRFLDSFPRIDFVDSETNVIEKYLEYCYKLDFESEPNYSGLQRLFDTTLLI